MPGLPVLHECDVLVVGGGPAGVAAAIELAAAGHAVELVEQGAAPGGAIHRQPASASSGCRAVRPQWRRLAKAMAATGFPVHTRCVFLGMDSDGLCLVEDRRTGIVSAIRTAAVVVAVGAVERVLPRPGTELPGVTTAGGMQVMLKETGRAPRGRILIAGNGPLTIALAAQLADRGNPPLAVLEAATPLLRPTAAPALLRHPRLLIEAAGYLRAMKAKGVAWRQGAALTAIERRGSELVAATVDRDGAKASLIVDHVALHDGIRPNSFGLPGMGEAADGMPVVVHAGDCREALGALSAEADGRRAARIVIAKLRGAVPDVARLDAIVARERSAQRAIARLFAPANTANEPAGWLANALLCRCEQKSVGELRALLDGNDCPSPREIKLNGRFCMGACQGRFCADAVADLMASARPGTSRPLVADLTGRRWPIRPASIASIVADDRPSKTREEQENLR